MFSLLVYEVVLCKFSEPFLLAVNSDINPHSDSLCILGTRSSGLMGLTHQVVKVGANKLYYAYLGKKETFENEFGKYFLNPRLYEN